jgi:hypothetical protein
MKAYFKIMIVYRIKFYFFKLKNLKNKKENRFIY